MRLSIVTTLYNSAPHVREFYERTRRAAARLTEDFEIVFVNDGSPDDAFAQVIELQRGDARVVGVDLSRNFGHYKAIMTGLGFCRGERVFLIDSDLEEDPELLAEFSAQMDARGCDVVYGVQAGRKGGWFERASGALFWRLFNWLSPVRVPANLITARLMTRRYVRNLVRFRDQEVFLAGLWQITGFEQVPLSVTKGSRGHSNYTLRRKFAVLVNSITSFSNLPLVLIFYVGLAISASAFGYIVYLVARWSAQEQPVLGWTSVIASVWLLGGLIISFLGVIGIYLSKVFIESKRRPYTVIRKVWRRGADERDG
ncbi:MAG: glycosyl transferase [Betaproteobacteria bacterium RIFCSPLOWO2_02_67_12]|nr:MAG: glycosyl transferase [Betaproteobacteria bacterium RIFCSPLOWO2_02_67_12]OGA30964.1 MAG: glycosyl transferase [Betaproteobacteria bacterium RIFCSPLOWO2_02_FULL_68_150]